ITKGWSCHELQAEIANRFGTRREGGRKPRMAKDLQAFLSDLESRCEEWRRWHKELDQPTARNDEHVLLSDLPEDLSQLIQDVAAQILGLHKEVIARLKRSNPAREVREFYECD